MFDQDIIGNLLSGKPENVAKVLSETLLRNEKIVLPNITGRGKARIYSLSVSDVPVRAKATESQLILVRDNNNAFIEALFPHLLDEWNARKKPEPELGKAVTQARLNMALKRETMEQLFANPEKRSEIISR